MNDIDERWLAPLEPSFYDVETRRVAIALLGKVLVRRIDGQLLAGRIVETEAYLHRADPACHAARGIKPKNAAMFGPPGRAYVYPIHAKWCFNVVTMPEGQGAAVLIRSLEPVFGVEPMKRHRNIDESKNDVPLTSGPSRLCQAMAIDRRQNGLALWSESHEDNVAGSPPLWIADDGHRYRRRAIGCSPRIGVTSGESLLLRWFVVDHPSVSGLKRWHREYGPAERTQVD